MTILSGIRSRGISDGLNWGISDWLRGLVSVLSISVVDLLADLFGESELNSLASRGSKLGDALLGSHGGVFDRWDGDALLLSEVLAADSWERDWLVDTGLDWLRVGNLNCGRGGGNNGDIVASLLGDLLAVVVSVAVVSISWGWLADGDHLGVALLDKGNLNSLGSGSFGLLLVRVCADLVVDLLNALGTDSTGDWVALFYVNNDLDGKLNWAADSLKSWGANFGRFNNI